MVDGLVQQACDDLQKMLVPSTEISEKIQELETTAEALLTHADEQKATLEMVRLEASQISQDLPQLLETAEQLKKIFQMIDSLEGVVAKVSESVTKVESKVTTVESHVRPSTFKTIVSVFKSREEEQLPTINFSESILDVPTLMQDLQVN
eukprot:c1498_g1_i1.p1 GENE.c1498_g1_i1~~c1498_g1_i1.p1  ORF type:complete len:150 (-),score=47.94 c1498_g1_i1:110-559(-)